MIRPLFLQRYLDSTHFPVLASNSSHCHPADSVFDTDILLSHAFCPSLCRYGLVKIRRSRARVLITSSLVQQCHAPKLVAVTKFSHPWKLMPTVIWYYVSPWWWAWPQTSRQRGQYFPVLASNSSHCHPADSVFDTDILLSHAFCPSLCRNHTMA